jgi:predicted transcriptional regulator
MTKSIPKEKTHETKLLTDVELELMTPLWKLGEGSVADVIENLPAERSLAYTSVSTILRILEQKKILKTRKEGRGHIYIPLLKKTDYEAKAVRHVVEKVFDGTPAALVKQLLSHSNLDQKDLDQIKELLEKAGQKK